MGGLEGGGVLTSWKAVAVAASTVAAAPRVAAAAMPLATACACTRSHTTRLRQGEGSRVGLRV